MRHLKIIYLLLAVALFSCQDENDGVDIFGGEGKSKIVGMSSELDIKLGWNRLILNWENSFDPAIDSIEVNWSANKKSYKKILPGDATDYIIENLENFDYQINVIALDKEGNRSKALTTYSRPYTKDHEVLNTFLNIEQKFFFVNDKLIVIPNPCNDKNINPTLHYFVGDEEKTVEYTKEYIESEDFYRGFVVYENVNFTKPITFTRKGKIEECEDDILFDPYELKLENVKLNPYFEDELKIQHGSIDKAWINSVEEICIDFPVATLEDLVLFPNLKRLKFGSKRYFNSDPDDESAEPEIMVPSLNFNPDNEELTYFILDELTKKENPLAIEIYHDLFNLSSTLENAVKKEPILFVEKEYFDIEGWATYDVVGDKVYTDQGIKLYTVNMPYRIFYPDGIYLSPFRNKVAGLRHKITADMQEEKTINGFIVRMNNYGTQAQFPEEVGIQYSKDGENWIDIDPTRKMHRVGNHYAEVTNFELSTPIKAQHVRIIVDDNGPISGLFYVTNVREFAMY